MASDVSLSDGEMEDWEDAEDWTSTDWADPNGNKTIAYPVGHQNINAHTQDLKSRQAADSASSTAPPKSAEGTVVKRMLLNDNKAGMEGLDKDRINQIIHEASKGSKFYENERQKEEQMKRRIEEQRQKIQQISAELLRQGTAEADRLLEDFEQQRDLSRTVVHIDMDAFYAAVEMRDDPSLKNKPMAVGGNSMLSTSNYHARKFGVRAAMPGFIGRKLCPELVIVPTNFEKYTAVSREVKAIISEYDPNFCPMSLDEAYLDLTEHLEKRQDMSLDERTFICRDSSYADSRAHCKCDLNEIARNYGNQNDDVDLTAFFSKSEVVIYTNNEADESNEKAGRSVVCPKCKKDLPPFKCVTFGLSDEDTVNELRTRIEQKTTLTASAGIAPNMMLAKVCSDKNKPNGQYKIRANRQDVMDFIKDLPTRKISGIGKVSEAMLNAVGVFTCTDLYEKRGLLFHLYSQISFNYFMRICVGIGSTTVERDSERKSMSTERTFSEINRPADLYQKCEELCESLSEDLKSEQLKGKTVSIKIKTVKFEVRTRAHTVRDYTNDYDDIVQSARELLKTEIQNCAPQPLRLRLMGVRMSNLLHESLCQKKKQNTIIGAFKRLSKTSSKLETNNEILAVKDFDITETQSEATGSFQQAGTAEELGTILDMTNDKTKDTVYETVNIDIKNEWKMASDVLDEKGVNELPLDEGKSGKDRIDESDAVDKSVDLTDLPLPEGKPGEDRVDELDAADKSPDLTELPLHVGKSDKDREDELDAIDKSVELTKNSVQKIKDVYDCVIVSRKAEHLTIKENENVDRIICDKDINADEFVCNAKTEKIKNVMLENSVSQEIEMSIYSPTLRKTRSGFIRTAVSKARRKNRKGGKAKESAVTYECPVCSLNILCENLQSFNEHVDNCLESGENGKHGGCDKEDFNVTKQKTELNNEYGSMPEVKTEETVGTPEDSDISVISSDSLKTVAKESKLKENFVMVGLASADEKIRCGSTNARENTEISEEIDSDAAMPESEVGTCFTSKDETDIVCTSTNDNISTDNMDTNGTIEASPKNSPYNDKNSKELAKSTIGICMDSNRENNCSTGKDSDTFDTDTKTESKQGHALTVESNEDTLKDSESRTQGNSVNVDSEFEESEITSDNFKGCQIEVQENSTSPNETGAIQEIQLDMLELTAMTVNDSDKKVDMNGEELAGEASISMIPISPKVIIKNAAKTSEDCITKTGSSYVTKAMTVEQWNVRTVDLEQNLPCSSTQAQEKHIQIKESQLGRRKHRTDLSDDIEVLNEDGISETSAGDDDDVDDDRETKGSLLVCPICNIEQRSADLNEFNSHVDSCLSRGAISEILQQQKKQESGALKRSRASATPQSSKKNAKRRKTSMPNISKPCRSIASFFKEK